MDSRTAIRVTALVALLACVMVLALAVGSTTLGVETLVRSLGDVGGVTGGASDGAGVAWQSRVVWLVRMPRIVLAMLCGGALAVAGAAMQAVFRNPMADPGLLGVSSGASLGAVLALYLVPPSLVLAVVPLSAFAFAVLAATVAWLAASQRGEVAVPTLLLAGLAIGGICSALTSLTLALSLESWEIGRQMIVWLMGDFEGKSWSHAAVVAPFVVGGTAVLTLHARGLDALIVGEQHALAVGVDVKRLRTRVIALASLVTAVTVAVCGVIGFVGLMVPHLMRALTGPRHRVLLPSSFLMGAVLVVMADAVVRVGAVPELRVGVLTALCGGPFFLWVLSRNRQTTLRF